MMQFKQFKNQDNSNTLINQIKHCFNLKKLIEKNDVQKLQESNICLIIDSENNFVFSAKQDEIKKAILNNEIILRYKKNKCLERLFLENNKGVWKKPDFSIVDNKKVVFYN